MGKEGDKEDERKEAAIASTPCLQPNYKPKSLTQTQLSKFQTLEGTYDAEGALITFSTYLELHQRRLQIKSKSKMGKKPKGSKGKSHSIDLTARDTANQDSVITLETSTVCDSENHKNETSSVVQHEDKAVRAQKKSHKLHWGLDTKERWERKANM